jgi:prolyl-tRNA synthetase
LQTANIETLFDDREESAGVKFNDADLIGLPLRITISERSLAEGGVELKLRNQSEKSIIPLEETIPRLRSEIATMTQLIEARVTMVDYTE